MGSGSLAGLAAAETAVVEGEVALVVELVPFELGLLVLSEVLGSQKDLASLEFLLLSLNCCSLELLSWRYFPRNQNQLYLIVVFLIPFSAQELLDVVLA